ncbi:MAG: beta-propeller domain-containing protein [Polyangiaceae bacterium]|nr:beta-propeller domain-containing protein [Polyangiaceae bacterium]
MKHKSLSSLALLALSSLVAFGCSTEAKDPEYGRSSAHLKQAINCDDLLTMLKDDALSKMNRSIDLQIAMLEQYGYYGDDDYYDSEKGAPPAADAGSSESWDSPGSSGNSGAGGGSSGYDGPGSGAGGASSGAGGSSAGNSPPPDTSDGDKGEMAEEDREHSGTNTQVADVDEADIVKTDGNYIYLLHGQEFLVLTAWPAVDLAQFSSHAIEGTPTEMYVTDSGKVVVYSTVPGDSIYAGAGITPRRKYNDGYGYDGSDTKPVGPGGDYGYGSYTWLTKITVLELHNAQPSISSEMYFEGTYTSSRRVGPHVRTILQGAAYGPNISNYADYYYGSLSQMKAAYEQLRAQNAAAINKSTIEDWLPYYIVRTDGGLQAGMSACDEFYVPTAGTTEYGMTQIQSINLDAPENLPVGASIVGAVSTVYSNADTLVLAARAWVDYSEIVTGGSGWGVGSSDPVDTPPPGGMGGGSGEGSAGSSQGGEEVWMDGGTATPDNVPTDEIGSSSAALSTSISLTHTHLHTFDLVNDPAHPQYVASGTVPGYVLNQFSIDIHNGFLRVATTDTRVTPETYYWSEDTYNHLFVLDTVDDDLVAIGSVMDLAHDETIHSARFMGDRGYLVTFRQVDPLFVFDLSDPTAPKVLGELKIPGFSEYMHPLGENHLLTIGQDNGLALQIFDVSNPVNPVQAHKYVFDNSVYGYSEAQKNHKAFNYYASRGILAFPFSGYSAVGYDYKPVSSLELFDIDVVKGISPRGSIDHTDLLDNSGPYGYCGGYFNFDVRRGLFIENYVYSISYGGIKVHHIDALGDLVSELPLETPKNDTYGCSYYD